MSASAPWSWSDQYQVKMKAAGLRHEDDDVIVRGDVTNGSFSVLYLEQSRLVAIDSVNANQDFVHGRSLIESGAPIDRTRAGDSSLTLREAGVTQ